MSWIETADHIGSAVGGFATLGGVVFAWVQVRRWKVEKRMEARSAAAAGAIGALVELCHHLHGFALTFEQCLEQKLSAGAGPSPAEELRRMLLQFQKASAQVWSAISANVQAATIHLDGSEIAPVQRAVALRWRLEREVEKYLGPTFTAVLAIGEVPELTASLREISKEARQILDAGEAVFTPIARFEAAPQSRNMTRC